MTTAVAKKENPNLFKKGDGRPRKPVGTVNRYTRVIKEALLVAAELEGSNGNGKDKLIGYMRRVARDDMRAFCMMLSRAMPLQVEQRTVEVKEQVVYKSVDEVKRELASRGISMDVMIKIMKVDDDPLGETIDGDPITR